MGSLEDMGNKLNAFFKAYGKWIIYVLLFISIIMIIVCAYFWSNSDDELCNKPLILTFTVGITWGLYLLSSLYIKRYGWNNLIGYNLNKVFFKLDSILDYGQTPYFWIMQYNSKKGSLNKGSYTYVEDPSLIRWDALQLPIDVNHDNINNFNMEIYLKHRPLTSIEKQLGDLYNICRVGETVCIVKKGKSYKLVLRSMVVEIADRIKKTKFDELNNVNYMQKNVLNDINKLANTYNKFINGNKILKNNFTTSIGYLDKYSKLISFNSQFNRHDPDYVDTGRFAKKLPKYKSKDRYEADKSTLNKQIEDIDIHYKSNEDKLHTREIKYHETLDKYADLVNKYTEQITNHNKQAFDMVNNKEIPKITENENIININTIKDQYKMITIAARDLTITYNLTMNQCKFDLNEYNRLYTLMTTSLNIADSHPISYIKANQYNAPTINLSPIEVKIDNTIKQTEHIPIDDSPYIKNRRENITQSTIDQLNNNIQDINSNNQDINNIQSTNQPTNPFNNYNQLNNQPTNPFNNYNQNNPFNNYNQNNPFNNYNQPNNSFNNYNQPGNPFNNYNQNNLFNQPNNFNPNNFGINNQPNDINAQLFKQQQDTHKQLLDSNNIMTQHIMNHLSKISTIEKHDNNMKSINNKNPQSNLSNKNKHIPLISKYKQIIQNGHMKHINMDTIIMDILKKANIKFNDINIIKNLAHDMEEWLENYTNQHTDFYKDLAIQNKEICNMHIVSLPFGPDSSISDKVYLQYLKDFQKKHYIDSKLLIDQKNGVWKYVDYDFTPDIIKTYEHIFTYLLYDHCLDKHNNKST